MASTYQDIAVTFEKGLVTENEESVLDEGQAAELLNWEPAPYGGLRARNQWDEISKTGLTDYKVRGWATVPIGSGGGYATPSIVQQTSGQGITTTSPDENTTSPQTVTLNGCTAGNVIIVAVTMNDNSPSPTQSGGSGWTQVYEQQGGSTVSYIALWSKMSTGGTETITFTKAGNELHHLHMFEVSGLTSATPTATDHGNNQNGSPHTRSCTSITGSGFAFSFGFQVDNGAWTSPPSLPSGTTRFDTLTSTGGVRSTGVTANYSSTFTITDTIEPNTFTIGADGLQIWDAAAVAATPADFYILIAVATSTGYSIYRIPRDQILTGTWELVDSEACSDTSAFVSMTVSTGELIWSASTMSNPRHVVLSTLTGADTTDLSSKAGRAVCSHKDRVFVGGSSANPSRLYFSGIGTPHTFTTATDYLDIGGDDGEAIEDLISVEGLLLVCKVNRLYLISGSGVESFFVNELPGGSSSTGRPAIRTPYGTIVAGPTDVWNVQGGGVDPLGRPLGAGYSISGLVSTAYAQDTALICDSATGTVFRINLVTGAWSNESVTEGDDEPGHLFSLQSRFYYGVSNSNSSIGGTRRLSSSRNVDFTGTETYRASTGRVSLQGPAYQYTPRYVYLQARLQNESLPNHLDVIVETNHGSRTFQLDVTSDTQRERRAIGWAAGADWIKLTFTCNSSVSASAIDVEKVVIGVDSEAPR